MAVQPEHLVHPIDRNSPDAANLRSLSGRITGTSERYLAGSGTFEQRLREVAGRAKEFSLDLGQYWSHSVNFARDGYVYGIGADTKRLNTLTDALKTLSSNLDRQITTFEEATSPYTDAYDVGKIYAAGDELLKTIGAAMAERKAPENISVTDAQQVSEASFNLTIGSALAGLLEQVGARLQALGAGQPVARVVMPEQTRQIVDRAETDLQGDKLTAQVKDALALHDTLKDKCSEQSVTAMWASQTDLLGKIRTASADDKPKLQAEFSKAGEFLDAFGAAIDEVKKTPGQTLSIKNARDAITAIDRRLTTAKMTDQERAATMADRDTAAKALLDLQMPFLSAAVAQADSDATDAQDRVDAYQERLDDAKTAAAHDPADYWRDLKKSFLREVGALSTKVSKNLDGAFDSDFSAQLKDWNTQLAKTPPNAGKLRDAASSLLETIEVYTTRSELILRQLDAGPAAAQVQDELHSGLAAIRESVAKELQFLFDNGAFEQA
jgi:hypothetical protein